MATRSFASGQAAAFSGACKQEQHLILDISMNPPAIKHSMGTPKQASFECSVVASALSKASSS